MFEQDAASDSGDEAPEEVPLSVSKAQAAASDSRRTTRGRQRKQTQNDKGRQRRASAVRPSSAEPEDLPEAAAEQPEEDALPEDIIEALTAAQESASIPQATPGAAMLEPMPQQQMHKPRQPVLQRKAGPFTVQMLDSSRSQLPSESATQFVQKRWSADKKRSFEMLQPCQRWSGRHSKTIRHCINGPALQFVKSKS